MLTKEQIKQIAKEYGRKKGATELAKEMGVSKQRIFQIVSQLRKVGVKIPSPPKSYYKYIAEELREENPELFE
jgi:biotin operon repressor